MTPDISIVIPCRNENKFIDSCLESIFAQELDNYSYEVIVVDGNSDDGTLEKLKKWQMERPDLRVLNNEHKIVPIALNMGIKSARAQIIIRVDVHSQYPPNYLSTCLETMNRVRVDNVGGVFITIPRGNSLSAHLVQALTTHPFGVGNAIYRLSAKQGYADTVPYGCYRKDLFDEIGWFDERLIRNQDYEFNQRILATGGKIWLNRNIQIFYYNQSNLIGLLRQAIFTGQWNSWMWWVAPYSFRLRHVIPGGFVLYLVTMVAVASLLPQTIYFLAIPFVFYFILSIVSSVQQMLRYRNFLFLLLLPFLFFMYHLSYGIGILFGFVKLIFGLSPVGKETRPWVGAEDFRVKLGRLKKPE